MSTSSCKEVICPYCGHVHQPNGRESSGNYECEGCGKIFVLSVEISYNTTQYEY
jgi:uncharacterized Zn-finger protein